MKEFKASSAMLNGDGATMHVFWPNEIFPLYHFNFLHCITTNTIQRPLEKLFKFGISVQSSFGSFTFHLNSIKCLTQSLAPFRPLIFLLYKTRSTITLNVVTVYFVVSIYL